MLYPLSYEGEGGYCAICCAKLPLKPILCAGHRTTDPGFVRSGGACGPMGPVGRAGAAWGRLKGRPGPLRSGLRLRGPAAVCSQRPRQPQKLIGEDVEPEAVLDADDPAVAILRDVQPGTWRREAAQPTQLPIRDSLVRRLRPHLMSYSFSPEADRRRV